VSSSAPVADLDRIAGHVYAARRAALLTHYLITNQENADDLPNPAKPASEAAEQTGAALRLLDSLGARPALVPVSRNPIPLAQLDTPDVRELLRLVREALPVAERIDKARGRALDAGSPFAVLGLDLAEEFEHLAIRLETEIFGPNDLRQGSSKDNTL
jgi:hypothetical protein